MRGLARAQPHLRRFTFWNSHTSRLGKQEIGKTQILEIEFVERAPIRRARLWRPSFGFRGAMGRRANSIALPVAPRIRGQIQQDILSNERREIDRLRPGKLGVEGELRHANRVHEALETGDARQLDRLRERAIGPKRAFGNPEVERKLQRARARDSLLLELGDGTFLFAFEVQAVGGDLSDMNFHSRDFSEFTREDFSEIMASAFSRMRPRPTAEQNS